ncbi:hypothetical protein [Treponema sp. J25]|uniref:hypothetical protein n=1 Tax=Treponema sp. J25 TaxID=2094121 RepID=UPI00104CF1E4|nr:hypothetical protein [Treponema sp. J25]
MRQVVTAVILILVILSGCGKEKMPPVASEQQPGIEKENVNPPEKKKAKKVLPVSNIAELGERQEACLIPFNGKVYYTGGYNNSMNQDKEYNDLWVTEDFINWSKLMEPAYLIDSYYIKYALIDDGIIIFQPGSWKKDEYFFKIDKDNRITKLQLPQYEQIIKNEVFQYYFDHFDERLYYNPYLRWIDNELYLLDCYHGLFKAVDGKFENIYRSRDVFGIRLASNYQEHNGKLFLIAGGISEIANLNYDGYCNDVWVTEDILKPAAWKQIGKIRPSVIAQYGEEKTRELDEYRRDIYDTFPAREYAVTVSFKGKLYIMGGRRKMVDLSDGKEKYYWYKDVWCSEDGISWEQIVGPEYDENFVPPGWKLLELYGD